jgi:hypothetical protein
VKSLVALEPKVASGYAPTEARIAAAPFPVERARLRADASLPFDAGRFDCVVSTWTRFRHKGPGVLAQMFRGVATRAA